MKWSVCEWTEECGLVGRVAFKGINSLICNVLR